MELRIHHSRGCVYYHFISLQRTHIVIVNAVRHIADISDKNMTR